MRRARAAALLPIALALSAACTSFPAIERGTCGNGVVDANEDCDSFAAGGATACRPAGSAGACFFDCRAPSTCPDGYGCGADSVCRRGTGAFAPLGAPVSAGAWRVTMADFDGDGRADALTRGSVDGAGAAKLRLHFFGDGGALARTLFVPEVWSPVVTDVNGDGRADLSFVYPPTSGLALMLGRADRTLSPAASPTFSLPGKDARMALVYGLTGGTDVTFLVGNDQAGMLVHDDDSGAFSRTLAVLPDGPQALAGPIARDWFFDDPSAPCAQLALAYASGDPAAYVVSPCTTDSGSGHVVWNDAATPVKVSLPAGVTLDGRGVRSADVDHDGYADLLLGGVQDGEARTFVAYSDGKGGFHANAGTVNPGAANTASAWIVKLADEQHTPFIPELPVAVGQLTADDAVDFITRQSLFVSAKQGGETVYVVTQSRERGDWTSAAIGDLDADGIGDVVAGSDAELDLDVFLGTPGVPASTGNAIPDGLFSNAFSVPTDGPIDRFALGDFDGDSIQDVALAQRSTQGGQDQLQIAWGRAFEPPDTLTFAGELQSIEQVLVFAFDGSTRSNLAVLSTPGDGSASTSVAILAGSGDRQPLATMQLTSRSPPVTGIPLGFVLDRFQANQPLGVVALAGDAPPQRGGPIEVFRLWTAETTSTTQLASPAAGDPLSSDLHPIWGTTDAHFAILAASGDVDRDGVAEAIAMTPTGGSESSAALLVGRVQGAKVALASTTPVARTVSPEGQLAIVDVDGDGAADVVLLSGKNADKDRDVVVYWNDGSGGFAESRSLVVDASGENAQGFAVLPTSAGGRTIAYTTATQVVLARLDDGGRAVSARDAVAQAVGATGLGAGDVDGDGLWDLVVVDSTNLVLLGAEAREKVQP